MTSKKKKILLGLMGCCLIVVFLLSPFFQVVKSYSVMAIYSTYHKVQSSLYKEGIRIRIPGGLKTIKKDYYPFVMTYDTSEEYSSYIGEPVDLVVLYNFGAMQWWKGSSLLYEKKSPYYSGFYGAYVARFEDTQKQYGMNSNGTINVEEIMNVTDFDLKHLVLNSVGCDEPVLNYEIIPTEQVVERLIDTMSFQVIDAKLMMTGLWHEYESDYMAYIQYGRPPKEETKESFETIEGYGRIYIHFDIEKNISYFFYIIAPTKETIEETEENFILKSTIKR